MLQSSPCTSPPIDFDKIMGAWKDRLPFQVCPQNLVYHTLQKMSNSRITAGAFRWVVRLFCCRAVEPLHVYTIIIV
ncbi:hypothetical protein RUMCAL_00872 [Ruminococcus callidus ATCC 27760]|uniref:Uncharacterized protein n=1 Tax=Ruminococcus callidus ATCC 27760 TaxID=411473 RepID=U2KDZ8_9FIRM|nr:hypothetical protein RUMCAL_00872 [Ruminococcus callidus ATCC 27760]